MTHEVFSFYYEGTKIPCKIHFSDTDATVTTVLFLGTVQIGKIPHWIASKCPPGTAIIQGAPHWRARADGSTIPDFMFQYTIQSFNFLRSIKNLDFLKVIADSQAAPGVISLFAMNAYRTYLNTLVLLQPLGLNNEQYAGDKPALSVFKNRLALNTKHQLAPFLIEHKLRYNHYLIATKTGLISKKSSAHYGAGLNHNAIAELKTLYTLHNRIEIIVGQYDALFPVHEIQRSLNLAKISIVVTTVPGVPHSPLATKHGRKLLEAALDL